MDHRGKFVDKRPKNHENRVYFPNHLIEQNMTQPGPDVKYGYSLLVTTADQTGRRHIMQITGVPLWFAVKVPIGVPAEEFRSQLLEFLGKAHSEGWTYCDVAPVKTEINKYRNFMYWDPDQYDWIILHYTLMDARKQAIRLTRSIFYNVDDYGVKALKARDKMYEIYEKITDPVTGETRPSPYVSVEIRIDETDRLALPSFNANWVTVAYFHSSKGQSMLEEQFQDWQTSMKKVLLTAQKTAKKWISGQRKKSLKNGKLPSGYEDPKIPDSIQKAVDDAEFAVSIESVKSLIDIVFTCDYCSKDCGAMYVKNARDALNALKDAGKDVTTARAQLDKLKSIFGSKLPKSRLICNRGSHTRFPREEDIPDPDSRCVWACEVIQSFYKKIDQAARHQITKWYYETSGSSADGFVPLRGVGNLETGHDALSHYYRTVARDPSIGLSFANWLQIDNSVEGIDYEYPVKTISQAVSAANERKWPRNFWKNKRTRCGYCRKANHCGCSRCIGGGTVISVPYTALKNVPNPKLEIDAQLPLIHAYFDNETVPGLENAGELPLWHRPGDKMTMIGVAYGFVGSSKPLGKIAFTTAKSASTEEALAFEEKYGVKTEGVEPGDNDFKVIYCKSERDLIIKFGKLLGRIQPDMISGFNDQEYDWPWIVNRAITTNCLPHFNATFNTVQLNPGVFDYATNYVDPDEYAEKLHNNQFMPPSIVKTLCDEYKGDEKSSSKLQQRIAKSVASKYFKATKMKLEAGTSFNGETYEAVGCIPIDLRVFLRGKFPKAEKTSLNWFLQNAKIATKMADMPYQQMFDIFRQAHAELNDPTNSTLSDYSRDELRYNMWRVARYCVVDSWRCNALFTKYNAIHDARTLSAVTCCTMRDSFMYAGGMKVRNYAFGAIMEPHYNMMSSSHSNGNTVGDNKFPGAFVCEPERGLRAPKLTLDQRAQRHREDKLPVDAKNVIPGAPEGHPSLTLGGFSEEKYNSCNWTTEQLDVLKRFVLEFGYDEKAILDANIGDRAAPCDLLEFPELPHESDIVLGKPPEGHFGRFLAASEKYPNGAIEIYDFNHNAETNKETGATEFVYRDVNDVDGDINPHDYEEIYNLDETKCGEGVPRRTIIVPRLSDSEVKWALSQPGLIDFLKEGLKLLVTALDFSSLYPSLMMTYNLSPDRIIPIHRPDLREKAHKMGLTTHEIKFPFKGGIAAAWAVRHDNKLDPELHDTIDENGASCFQDGVFSHIEKKLFARRNAIKKQELKPAAKIKHQLHETLQKIEKGEMKVSPEELAKIREDKRQADFTWADADARQRAVKLIMNTLYGVSGDKTSPFYVSAVAGGITSAGRHCIMVAKKLVEAEGHKVVYGDTDSLYIEPKLDIFKVALWLYYGGLITRDELSRRIVEITVWYTKNLQKRVNDALEADNGTKTMKMAYEEVLHPCVMVRMKKYAGLAHENGFEGLSVMNYKWNQVTRRPIIPGDNVFLRGLDVVRRGTNDLTIRAFFSMLMYMCSADCRHSLQELVVRILDRTIAMDWPLETFAISQQYKPKTMEQRLAGKGNKTVLRFVDHMVARGLKFVPMERFKTVVVKRPVMYGPNGCPIKLKMADRIELIEQAEARNDELDLAHYMDGDTGILSMASKILSAWPRFEVAPVVIPTCGTANCIMSADYGTAAHKPRCDARTVPSRDENRTAIKASSDAVLKWLQSRVSVDGHSEESKAAAKEIVSDRRFLWRGVMRVLSEKFHMKICSSEPSYSTLSSIVMSELGIPAPRLKSGVKRFEVVTEESKRKSGFRDTIEIANTSKHKTRYVVPTGIIDPDAKIGGTKKWQQTIKKTLAAANAYHSEMRAEFDALPKMLRGSSNDENFNKYLHGIFVNFQNIIWKTYQQVKNASGKLVSNLEFNEVFKNVAHHVSMNLQSEYFDEAEDEFDRDDFTADVEFRVNEVLDEMVLNSEKIAEQVEMLTEYAETVKSCKSKIAFIEQRLFMVRQVIYLQDKLQQEKAAYVI